MTKTILLLTINLLTFQSYGQTSVQTEEVQLQYNNGYVVFTVCTSGCQTTFDDWREYFWYNEFSKIKSTKGGSGGSLLHGNFKFYDVNGNLRQDENYYLGLPEGSEKNWDSVGNIISQKKYSKGDVIYKKFQGENGYWFEEIGAHVLSEGYIKKVYTKNNSLISEQIMQSDLKWHTKIYYEYGDKKLKKEYTVCWPGNRRDYMSGKYTAYYEDGKIEIDGQFYEGMFTNIRVGTWKYYESDGTLDATEEYKAVVEYWSNGEMKSVGGYILDTDNTWKETGEWNWYAEDGKFQSSKKYEWGVEINE